MNNDVLLRFRAEVARRAESRPTTATAPPPTPATRTHDDHQYEELRSRLTEAMDRYDIAIDFSLLSVACQVVVFSGKQRRNASIKRASITALTSAMADIQLFMGARMRLSCEDPQGNPAILIEISRRNREYVKFQSLLAACDVTHGDSIVMVVGKDAFNQHVSIDLRKAPHVLIAGQTGGGKSVFLQVCIESILRLSTASLTVIDTKRLDTLIYRNKPRIKVVNERLNALEALNGLIDTMEKRYEKIENSGYCSLDEYNRQVDSDARMVPNVVVIDEIADLLMGAEKEIREATLKAMQLIAQKGRAAAIHLIAATQRPSVAVLPGDLKMNMPVRVSFSMATGIDSEVILGERGAEALLSNGDGLIRINNRIIRFQSAML